MGRVSIDLECCICFCIPRVEELHRMYRLSLMRKCNDEHKLCNLQKRSVMGAMILSRPRLFIWPLILSFLQNSTLHACHFKIDFNEHVDASCGVCGGDDACVSCAISCAFPPERQESLRAHHLPKFLAKFQGCRFSSILEQRIPLAKTRGSRPWP